MAQEITEEKQVVEEEQREEITRLKSQVDQLQQQLRSSTAEVDRLRSAAIAPDTEQLQTVKAELDHERQKAKAIWAAVRQVAGEDAVRRVEEEVSRRPIVAAPKVRRRGTMPHMPAPHLTVITKTAATPKWPPGAQEEVVTAEAPAKVVATVVQPSAAQGETAAEAPAKVVATVVPADQSEGPKPEFDVDSHSVPPSVARRLFDLGLKGKDQRESIAPGESLSLKLGESLTLKLDDEPQSARVAEVPSPMRKREPSMPSFSSVPPLPRQKVAPTGAVARSVTPTGAVLNRRVPMETPPPPQVKVHDAASMASPATSVRDRIRQLELSARRNSIPS